jgi:VWFA-related protein
MDLTPHAPAHVVGVVVMAFDKQGHAVTNLKQEDFEIDDDSEKQTIGAFTPVVIAPAQSPPVETARAADTSPQIFSNREADDSSAIGQAHATILFLDGADLNAADLAWVCDGIQRFLPALPPDESVGLYAREKDGFQIVAEATTDRASLTAKLSQWAQSNNGLTGDSNSPRDELPILIAAARHLAVVPGHKNLIWIAATIPDTNESNKSTIAEQHLRTIDDSVFHARNEMGDANVSFYPLIASQPQSGAISGDHGGHGGKLPPQIVAPDLAQSTGGRELHRAEDLAAALKSVIEEGRATYRLTFTPDVPADGQYHHLQVKLTPARGITLRYRTGYLSDREPTTIEQRFRDAIWQQNDAKDIAISAGAAASLSGKTLKLNISTADLDLSRPEGFRADKLDIYAAQRDEGQQHSEVSGKTLELRLKSATYQKLLREGIPFDQLVKIKPETTSVRIVVVDENSGRIGSITVPVSAIK